MHFALDKLSHMKKPDVKQAGEIYSSTEGMGLSE